MNRFFQNRIVQHIGFWIIGSLVLLRFFSDGNMWSRTNIIYTLLFELSLIPGVYLNIEYLLPKYWAKYRWIPYTLFILLTIIVSVLFNELIFQVLADWIFPGYYFISYYTYFEIAQFVIVFLFLSTLLKLSKSWFELQSAQKALARMRHSQKESELKALKDQINPHFLFNSLHLVYSLTVEKDDKAPEILLKLSEVLRFMLYETNADKIPLEKEIKCIRDYLEIQKLRLPENIEIRSVFEHKGDDLQISPLLLMPLVENCFKHGDLGPKSKGFVDIWSKLYDSELTFTVINSRSRPDADSIPGIGLANLRKRLELLYPGKHRLEKVETPNVFTISLKIAL